MANKVSIEISANTTAYQQGINQACDSAEKYETETRKVADAQVNLMKELKLAKREVMNLAAGYAKLDDEAKKSSFGREMARQLEEAKQKAAEYIDLQGDLNTELKNMASDTATFDALANGVSALGSTMSAVTGVMGIFTDDTQMMQRAVTMFTTAESIANAAIKVSNLLQKQSSLMKGINTLQTRAATAAENIHTAAVGAGTTATVAATAAQEAFNTVAKANPYVLLASAIIAVGGALWAFCSSAEDATEAQNKLTTAEENGKKASETYASTLSNEFSKLMTNYTKLKAQWAALANDTQRKKFIEDHKSELRGLGAEINNVKDAEGFFNSNTQKIVQAFQKRAQSAALAAKAAELYRQQMELIEKNRQFLESDRSYKAYDNARDWMHPNGVFRDRGADTYNGGKFKMNQQGQLYLTEKGAEEANKATKEWQDLNNAYHDVNDQIARVTQQYEALVKESGFLSDSTTTVTNTTNNHTSATQREISTYEDAIAEYDKMTKKLQELNELKNRIDPQYAGEFQKEIDAIGGKIQEIADKWHIKAKIDPIIDTTKNIDSSKIQDIMSDAFSNKKSASSLYDFSSLPQEFNKSADEVIAGMSRIEKAKESLSKLMSEADPWSEGYAQASDSMIQLSDAYEQLREKADVYQELSDAADKLKKHNEKVSQSVQSIGNAVQSAGEMFTALGKLTKNTELNIAGLVAQAIATVALSYAQALSSAKTWVDWLAFGLSGAATMINLISQIKAATAGTGSYANGGIIPGSSYSGDNLMAHVNSGEMILNKRQQQNLFNMLDTGAMPQHGGSNVRVTGVIHGTDLLLVQKNTNKLLNKTGNKISF